jgi:ABC-type spermidine/putrescine transport system permease subunit II
MVNNMTAVVISMTHSLMPLAVLTMFSVMDNIDRRLVQAGATLGGSGAQTFWRIYFPLSLNGVLAAAVLVFISSLGFFITPAILGSPNETMIAQVIMRLVLEMSNWNVGGALAVILFLSALAIFLVFQIIFGSVTMGGEEARARKAGEGLLSRGGRTLLAGAANLTDGLTRLVPDRILGGRTTLQAVSIGGIVFLAAPALIVIPVSFNDSQFLQFPPSGFSLRWYEEFFGSDIWMTATARSFLVALATAVIAVVTGTAAAFVLVREQLPGKGLLMSFIMAPLILPRMAVAVALFFFLAKLGLASTPFALVIGHSILAIPYVVITVSAVLKRYDRRLDQAASSLGASPARVRWHVTLPLIQSGLFAAGLFAFITSFDDLNIALFVSGGLQNTLPNQMWSSMYLAASPILGAASTVILVTLSVILVAAELLRRASERKLALLASEN